MTQSSMPDTLQASRQGSRHLENYLLPNSTPLRTLFKANNPSHHLPRLAQIGPESGSCHIHHGRQIIGAGVYHPDTDSPNYVQPNEAEITNAGVRAELAAIAATILPGHSHIATDSLSSLHKFRKQKLCPELTVSMSKAISLSAIAKHQAIQGDDIPAKTTFPFINLEGNPFHDTTWLAFEGAPRTHASTSERQTHLP
eukprot:906856-Pelagomonas_calceolata.AAC.1